MLPELTHFNSCLPPWAICLWLLAMAALLFFSFMRHKAKLRLGYSLFLVFLESIAIAAATVIILQPMVKKSQPEDGGYRIVMLADKSFSMTAHDDGGKLSRMDIMANTLANTNTAIIDFLAKGRLEAMTFAHETRLAGNTPAALTGLDTMPGLSPIGDTLDKILEDARNKAPVAAVILLSDGHFNTGSQPTETAKRFKSQGIPINCIGIGSNGKSWDISVQTDHKTMKTTRDTTFPITATISNSFTAPRQIQAQLLQNGMELQAQTIEVPAESSKEITFQAKARTEGFHTFTIRIPHLEGDSRNDNDVDYATVNVQPPPVFRILFLQGGMDWEQRFINQFSAGNEQYSFSAIVMTAKDSFLHSNLTDEQRKLSPKFPASTEFYEDFDALVLDSRTGPFLTTEGISAIRAFVEHKGGGLLVRGPLRLLPPELLDIMPAKDNALVTLRAKTIIKCSQDFIFNKDKAGVLTGSMNVFLPPNDAILAFQNTKSASRTAVSLADANDTPVLIGMAFGAGRVAATGLESTWRWRLTDNMNASHDAFWQSLLLWLAETGKPRIRELTKSSSAVVGEDHLLDLSIIGDDFLASPDASVTATIIPPTKPECKVQLDPQWEEEGRYTAAFTPAEAGEYQVHYEVRLPQRVLKAHASFVARQIGPEAKDVTFNEALLRDISRISGGRYFTPSDYLNATSFPISRNIPMKETTMPLASSWWLFAIIAGVSASLWWARRRIGLK